MEQDETDALIRRRIREWRSDRGWSLDVFAERCGLSPSTLSRIETGHRRIALDQLIPIARAFGSTLDALVDPGSEQDVVIRPAPHRAPGVTTWLLSRPDSALPMTVAKLRITTEATASEADLQTHPGRDWLTVLSGTLKLRLGRRTLLIESGHAAEFSTQVPHAFGAHHGPVEILTILDHDGEQSHLPSAR